MIIFFFKILVWLILVDYVLSGLGDKLIVCKSVIIKYDFSFLFSGS